MEIEKKSEYKILLTQEELNNLYCCIINADVCQRENKNFKAKFKAELEIWKQ